MEDRRVLDRLLSSVVEAQKYTSWKVTVVVAAEAGSLMVTEGWDIDTLSPAPADVPVLVAVHPSGLPGERPGLGSNLHHAVKFIMQDTSTQCRARS